MDIMESAKESLSIHEITKRVDQYLSVFESPKVFDESTIRKKLREYVNEGIIESEKCGKTLYYKKTDQIYKGKYRYPGLFLRNSTMRSYRFIFIRPAAKINIKVSLHSNITTSPERWTVI